MYVTLFGIISIILTTAAADNGVGEHVWNVDAVELKDILLSCQSITTSRAFDQIGS